jgi:hypothetical protein
MLGVDGMTAGIGYGENEETDISGSDKDTTVFANYSVGPVTFGGQVSELEKGTSAGTDETAIAWGIALNVNENLSVSYGEREVDYDKFSGSDVTEKGEGIAVAYTMGSMKVAGNMNEVSDNDGTAGSTDSMTEIALSFAF